MNIPASKNRPSQRRGARPGALAPSGFTLVELMIVVVIIGILAAIAIPQFQKFQLRAKHSEVGNVIGELLTSELAFAGKWGAFVLFDQFPTVARIGGTGLPHGEKTSWFEVGFPTSMCFSPGGTGVLSGGPCQIGFAPAGKTYFAYTVVGTTTSFSAPLCNNGGAAVGGFDTSVTPLVYEAVPAFAKPGGGSIGIDTSGYPCAVGFACTGTAPDMAACSQPGIPDIAVQATGDLDNDGLPLALGDHFYLGHDEVRDLRPSDALAQYGESIF